MPDAAKTVPISPAIIQIFHFCTPWKIVPKTKEEEYKFPAFVVHAVIISSINAVIPRPNESIISKRSFSPVIMLGMATLISTNGTPNP